MATLSRHYEEHLLLWAGFGVGVAGGPVFGREGHVPESGIGEEEFDADLDLLIGKFVNVRDDAFERIFGLRIRERETLAAIHRGAYSNERAVSADGERKRVFLGARGVAGMRADADGNFHQDTLAAAAVVGKPRSFAGLVDPDVESATVFWFDGGEHQAHALAGLDVNDAALDFERFGALGHVDVGGGT